MLVAQREQEQLGLPGSLVAVSECPVLARLDSVPMRLVALEPVPVAASVAVSVAVASVAVSAVWAAVVGESRYPAPEQRECPRLIRLV